MKEIFNILVAIGAFKDVFSPPEVCAMVRSIIETIIGKEKQKKISIKIVPMADGGEYSTEVLSAKLGCKKIVVPNVINPCGMSRTSYCLLIDDDTVFIGSSQILRLSPELDRYKNPLNLTSYGLGQLIKDALNRNFKKIIIGLGGTSTVDGGIGMAQALGAKFLNKRGECLSPHKGKYFTGSDLSQIEDIVGSSISPDYKNIDVTALCDTKIKVRQMSIPTNMKISRRFDKERISIIKTLEDSLLKYCRIIAKRFFMDNLEQDYYCRNLEQQEGFGVAGGINLSLIALFKPHLSSGIDFFLQKFNVEELIKNSDLIITGEGKFDATITSKGKVPAGISRLAKRYNKPVLFLCGNVDSSLKKHFKSYLNNNIPDEMKDSGITAIISCHPYYENMEMPNSYKEEVELYRQKTPGIFSKALRLYFKKHFVK